MVVVDYDFSNTEGGVWVGIVADKDLEIQESAGPIRFRMKAAELFQLKFALLDSIGLGHEVYLDYSDVGQWMEVEIPFVWEAFGLHCGGDDPELAQQAMQSKQITFPFVKIAVFVNKTDSTAPKGTVTFADLPKK